MTLLLAILFGCKPVPLNDKAPGDDDDTPGDDDDDVVGDDDDDDDTCVCGTDQACVEGECRSCAAALTPTSWNDGSTLQVDLVVGLTDPEAMLFARTVSVSGGGTLLVEGGVDVVADDGTLLADGESVLDGAVLSVIGRAAGSARLGVTPWAGCADGTLVEIAAQVRPPRPLVGRRLDSAPGFERARLVQSTEPLSLVLDAVDHDDRLGQAATVYVVPDRDAAAWLADASLGDAVLQQGITLDVGPVEIWSDPTDGAGVVGRYDVVVDVDGDGALSPGDLFDGLTGPAFGLAGDLSAPGPHTPVRFDWSGQGRWIDQRVYYPDGVAALAPVPLVVISHGNGHDYRWYDYLGNHLASWGYVVMSHANNTEPGPVSASITTLDNTEALLANLASLQGGVLVGAIDDSRIAWLGHSRGGEGVVLAYAALRSGAQSRPSFGHADIALVSSIAPTLFEGPDQANPGDVAYHLLAGSSDGDVTGGPDCDICQYFRLFKNGTAESWVSYFQGSTHSDFHDVEAGAFDDGVFVTGLKVGPDVTQQAAKGYYLALLDHVLRGDGLLDDVFERPPERFRPQGANLVVSTQSRRTPDRRVIDDFQTEPGIGVASSGATISATVTHASEGLADDANTTLSTSASDPFNGMTWVSRDGNDAERVVVFQWDGEAELAYALPSTLTDQSDATHLSFRAAQVTRHPFTDQVGGMLSFEVELEDEAGTVVGYDFRAWGGAPRPAPRTGNGGGNGWVNEFQTIRVPLDAFTADGTGLDLARLATVRFRFGPGHGSEVGRIGLDDLEFVVEESP